MGLEFEPRSSLKRSVGRPLEEAGIIDEGHRQKLRALSVTTVEELMGLIAADPTAVTAFLEVHDLPRLQSLAFRNSASNAAAQLMAADPVQYSLGALPPAQANVEEVASYPTFDRYASKAAFPPAGAQPDGEADLRSCQGPVRDQGRRGTCVAHAICAVLECLIPGEDGIPDYSEQFVYWLAKQHDGIPTQSGTYINVAGERVSVDGVALEQIWPYNPNAMPGNESQGPAPEAALADAASRLAGPIQTLTGHSADEIRAALDDGKPVAFSVPVYDNWYNNPATAAFGLIPMPLPNSVLKGGHAMCAVGYAYDAEFTGGGYFIVRNSWGVTWASQSALGPGYGAIPFEYIDTYGWEAATNTAN